MQSGYFDVKTLPLPPPLHGRKMKMKKNEDEDGRKEIYSGDLIYRGDMNRELLIEWSDSSAMIVFVLSSNERTKFT